MAEETSGKDPSARQDAGLDQACWHSGYMQHVPLGPATRFLLRILGLCLGSGCPSVSQRTSQPASWVEPLLQRCPESLSEGPGHHW